MLATASEDDSILQWDLAVERDTETPPASTEGKKKKKKKQQEDTVSGAVILPPWSADSRGISLCLIAV